MLTISHNESVVLLSVLFIGEFFVLATAIGCRFRFMTEFALAVGCGWLSYCLLRGHRTEMVVLTVVLGFIIPFALDVAIVGLMNRAAIRRNQKACPTRQER